MVLASLFLPDLIYRLPLLFGRPMVLMRSGIRKVAVRCCLPPDGTRAGVYATQYCCDRRVYLLYYGQETSLGSII